MSETAKLSPDLNDTRIVFANEETFEKMKDYIFYCPCSKCNAEMRIRSRTLNDGDKTYYFSSNSHNKEKCTVYKKSKEKVSIRNGIQTVNHAIFQDQERRGGEGGNNPPGPGGTNGPKRMDPGTFQFQEDNPRLNNIDDYIKFIINSSFFDKINIGTKRKPNFKTLSQILFRYDNFDNYRGHDLSGIGIVWGGRRINANALGIQVEKNSIIIQEDLPYQIYLQNIAPILFKLGGLTVKS